MQTKQREEIKKIVGLFDRAEVLAKEVERLDGDLSIPTINELRYVGYHLARALCADSEQLIDKEIERADSHCRRAIYDANEVGIIFVLEYVKEFSARYSDKSHLVIEVISDYSAMLGSAQDAAALIDEVSKKHAKDREEYYEQVAPHYKALRKIYSTLLSAEPLVTQIIKKNESDERQSARRFITTVTVSISALLVSVVVGATMIFLKLAGS